MGFLSKILEKLGLKKAQSAPSGASASGVASPKPGGVGVSASHGAIDKGEKDNMAFVKAGPTAVSEVDVVKKLEQMAGGTGMNWKDSIVDLLKILGIDSSREARNELAKELGCPADMMSDSARMNAWLHKEVLRKIAENGGNIPQSLLD